MCLVACGWEWAQCYDRSPLVLRLLPPACHPRLPPALQLLCYQGEVDEEGDDRRDRRWR